MGNKDDKKNVNKYILEECAKFNLTEKTTNQEIEKYYKILTSLDDNDLSIKEKRIYLYNYLVNDMIKNNEVTEQEGKKFIEKIEKQIKGKSKERER